jgi:RNA polymerase sigma-70 factor (ECF subfamily)
MPPPINGGRSDVDEDEFVREYRALRSDLERHLRRSLDSSTAADLADETIARAWQSRATYDPDQGTPRQWIYGIARNVRSRHLRKLSRVAIGAQRSAVESHEGAVADRIDAAVAIGVLGAAVASLSASDVEVLAPVLVACLGGLELTRRTNAEHLRLHRIRQRLRLALDAGRR